jgi:hypothetical protein
MSITNYAILFVFVAILFGTGYITRMFVARNEQHVEALELRDTLHDRDSRIDQLKQEREDAYDEYDKLDRSYMQLEADHRATAEAYAQCEADLIVATGRLATAADELLIYAVDIRADWAEQDDERPEPAVETPAWDDITRLYPITEYREESPTEWLKRADVEAARKASADVEKRRKPARVPAQRGGDKS